MDRHSRITPYSPYMLKLVIRSLTMRSRIWIWSVQSSIQSLRSAVPWSSVQPSARLCRLLSCLIASSMLLSKIECSTASSTLSMAVCNPCPPLLNELTGTRATTSATVSGSRASGIPSPSVSTENLATKMSKPPALSSVVSHEPIAAIAETSIKASGIIKPATNTVAPPTFTPLNTSCFVFTPTVLYSFIAEATT